MIFESGLIGIPLHFNRVTYPFYGINARIGTGIKKDRQCRKDGISNQFRVANVSMNGGDRLGSVIKKRRKKMRKHKHRKLLARTRHQRRKGK
jgi:hypothetical protein